MESALSFFAAKDYTTNENASEATSEEKNDAQVIAREQIPISLKSAIDVTDEEYQTAKRHRMLLWLITFLGIVPGLYLLFQFGLIVIPIPVIGAAMTPVLTAIGFHFLAAMMLPMAKEMGTTRMQVYPALKVFVAGRRIEPEASDAKGEERAGESTGEEPKA